MSETRKIAAIRGSRMTAIPPFATVKRTAASTERLLSAAIIHAGVWRPCRALAIGRQSAYWHSSGIRPWRLPIGAPSRGAHRPTYSRLQPPRL